MDLYVYTGPPILAPAPHFFAPVAHSETKDSHDFQFP